MKQITIHSNWFFSAGQKYGWEDKHDRRGVGIRTSILKENVEVELVIAGTVYHLNCNNAILFIKTYKSLETHKGIRLGIVSKSVLNEVIKPKKTLENSNPQGKSQKDLQPKLF